MEQFEFSAFLEDNIGLTLYEFLIGKDVVLAIPSFAAYKLYESDPQNKVNPYGSHWRMPVTSFLQYLASLCMTKHSPYHLKGKTHLVLTQGLTVSDIHRATDISEEVIKTTLSGYLVFKDW